MPDTETTPERGMTSADKEEEDTSKKATDKPRRILGILGTNQWWITTRLEFYWKERSRRRRQRKKGRLKGKGRAPDVIP